MFPVMFPVISSNEILRKKVSDKILSSERGMHLQGGYGRARAQTKLKMGSLVHHKAPGELGCSGEK